MKTDKLLRTVFIFWVCTVWVFANDKLFFFPKEAKAAQTEIVSLIHASQKSINIAMYNLSMKSLAKELIKASQRGVKVTVFLDGSKVENQSSEYAFLKKNGIEAVVITQSKLHTKLAVFDKKIVLFGSPNWTKESFSGNYEVLYITDEKENVKKFNQFMKELKDQ
ncbi:MAG: phospholipase D-like domain-containing protein [Candidatus Marinarcus sp.]|uniref:phospholipase D-like domain-containing protein n=1 Tax=Candidatus Marinarcus sp. TaxID=3100987 RepID=UPI003B002207